MQSGSGELWSAEGTAEQVNAIVPGNSLRIPAGTAFQIRADDLEPLVVVGVTMPPWPGADEAWLVAGRWRTEPVRIARLRVETAVAEHLPALDHIAIRAKAWWRYDDMWLAQCARELRVDPQAVADAMAMVALSDVATADQPVGFAALQLLPNSGYALSHLFVRPEFIGGGIGRALLTAMSSKVRELGGNSLWVQSDPQAVPFYLRAGGTHDGEASLDSVAGRELSCFRFAC